MINSDQHYSLLSAVSAPAVLCLPAGGVRSVRKAKGAEGFPPAVTTGRVPAGPPSTSSSHRRGTGGQEARRPGGQEARRPGHVR